MFLNITLQKKLSMRIFNFKQTLYFIVFISLASGIASVALSLLGYQACIYCWILRITSFLIAIAGIAILAANKKKFTFVLTVLSAIGLIVSLWLSYIALYAPKFCTSDCSNQPVFFGVLLPIYVTAIFTVLLLLSAYAEFKV